FVPGAYPAKPHSPTATTRTICAGTWAAKANSLRVYSESMLSWPFFLKKNGTRRKSPLRTIREFALSSLLRRHCLDAGIQAALVAAGGVLMQNALLHALVQDRNRRAIDLTQRLRVATGDRLAQGAQRAAQLALVGAIDCGLGDGLTRTLQG